MSTSNTISQAFIEQFDAEVKQAYQGMAKLNGTVRTKSGVVGSTYRFTKIGKGLAHPHTPHADVTPMSVQYGTATAILQDYVAPEYSDIFQQQKINFDERRELVKVIAGSLGRRMDQVNIDAMVNSATTNTVDIAVGGNDAFNVGKIRRLGKQFDANGVPSSDRHLAVSATAIEQLLGTTQATSSDYNNVLALVNGSMNSFYGFKIHMIEDRVEGGLPLASDTRTLLAWHKDAIGCAIGINMSTEIHYVAEKVSWLVNGKLSLGAVAIDPDGVATIEIDESVEVNPS